MWIPVIPLPHLLSRFIITLSMCITRLQLNRILAFTAWMYGEFRCGTSYIDPKLQLLLFRWRCNSYIYCIDHFCCIVINFGGEGFKSHPCHIWTKNAPIFGESHEIPGFLFQVCDEPHPLLIKDMLQHCVNGNLDEAYKIMSHLWKLGYMCEDIISIVFRVCKNHSMPEYIKLEFIKVGH